MSTAPSPSGAGVEILDTFNDDAQLLISYRLGLVRRKRLQRMEYRRSKITSPSNNKCEIMFKTTLPS